LFFWQPLPILVNHLLRKIIYHFVNHISEYIVGLANGTRAMIMLRPLVRVVMAEKYTVYFMCSARLVLTEMGYISCSQHTVLLV